MATKSFLKVIIGGDLNQHLASRVFMELAVVHRLNKHKDFITHERSVFLDPVITDLSRFHAVLPTRQDWKL